MYAPSMSVRISPVAPNAAVVASAGMYSGASWSRKMLELTSPITLAMGTPSEVRRTRRFSSAMLLLYWLHQSAQRNLMSEAWWIERPTQVSSNTDGAEVPHVIMKHAKYATCSSFSTSIAA